MLQSNTLEKSLIQILILAIVSALAVGGIITYVSVDHRFDNKINIRWNKDTCIFVLPSNVSIDTGLSNVSVRRRIDSSGTFEIKTWPNKY